MSKNTNLLVDAYCDLIEAKLPITGKAQRRYLDELRHIATNYMLNNGNRPGLEDLYDMYGTPDTVARKLAAIMSDPESTDFDISRVICNHEKSENNKTKRHIRGCKRLTPEQAHNLMQKLSRGEEITPEYLSQFEDADIAEIGAEINKHCNCHNNNADVENKLAEMAAAFDEANAMADAGADIAEISLHTDIPTTALYLGGFGEPADDMTDYIIPVRFTMQGFVKVKATSVEDAIMTADMAIPRIPVPKQSELVPDTMKICHDESMVALFTDKFRLGRLKLEAMDTDIVTPLIDRDEMLDKADPNIIMDTILNIMGIDTDSNNAYANCNCDCDNDNHSDNHQWIPSETTDDDYDDADAVVEIDIECDGNCSECGIPESFGSCPIQKECANHGAEKQVMLHLTVPCYGECDECPIANFLGECPILNFDDNDESDDSIHAESYETDDCFFDDIDELPEELQPINFDEED